MLWSFILAGLSFAGFGLTYLLGNGHRWPWLGLAFLAAPWLAYAPLTGQWGFLASTAVAIAVNVRNWIRLGA